MSADNSKEHEEIGRSFVVGGQHSFALYRLRKFATLSYSVISVIVVGAVLFSWVSFGESKNPTKQPTIDPYKQAQTAVLNQAQQFEQAGKMDQEKAALLRYIGTNPPKQYQYQPLMLLGGIAYNQHDFNGAVTYYKQAVTDNGKDTEYAAAAIAIAAQGAGDNATAIYYYKEAIKLTPNTPGVANDISDYQSAIQYLEGK